jgi:hypothetical protein
LVNDAAKRFTGGRRSPRLGEPRITFMVRRLSDIDGRDSCSLLQETLGLGLAAEDGRDGGTIIGDVRCAGVTQIKDRAATETGTCPVKGCGAFLGRPRCPWRVPSHT